MALPVTMAPRQLLLSEASERFRDRDPQVEEPQLASALLTCSALLAVAHIVISCLCAVRSGPAEAHRRFGTVVEGSCVAGASRPSTARPWASCCRVLAGVPSIGDPLDDEGWLENSFLFAQRGFSQVRLLTAPLQTGSWRGLAGLSAPRCGLYALRQGSGVDFAIIDNRITIWVQDVGVLG